MTLFLSACHRKYGGLNICAPNKQCHHTQNTADARAQHGHTTFARTSVENAEATRGVREHASPEKFGIFRASQVDSDRLYHRHEPGSLQPWQLWQIRIH